MCKVNVFDSVTGSLVAIHVYDMNGELLYTYNVGSVV